MSLMPTQVTAGSDRLKPNWVCLFRKKCGSERSACTAAFELWTLQQRDLHVTVVLYAAH